MALSKENILFNKPHIILSIQKQKKNIGYKKQQQKHEMKFKKKTLVSYKTTCRARDYTRVADSTLYGRENVFRHASRPVHTLFKKKRIKSHT